MTATMARLEAAMAVTPTRARRGQFGRSLSAAVALEGGGGDWFVCSRAASSGSGRRKINRMLAAIDEATIATANGPALGSTPSSSPMGSQAEARLGPATAPAAVASRTTLMAVARVCFG